MVDHTPVTWDLVQTPTGKIIPRADSEVLEQESYVCEIPGHYGFYASPGTCRICGKTLVKKMVGVGFKEKA